MSDNSNSSGGTGDAIRTIDKTAYTGAKTPVTLLDIGGGDGTGESLVSAANPMPITDAGLSLTVDTGTAGQPLSVTDTNLLQATSSDAPIFVSVAGDPGGDFAGVNILESLVDPTSPTALSMSVVEKNPAKRDVNGMQMMSDAPAPIDLSGPVGRTFLIDTQGYQSLAITSFSQSASISAGNDPAGIFSLVLGFNIDGGSFSASLYGTNTNWTFPCSARYIKVKVLTAGAATAYLRSTPFVPNLYSTTAVPATNISQINGSAPSNPGVAGGLTVGGNIAPGSARTLYPMPVSGVDSANLTRVLLTDTTGKLLVVPAMDTQGNYKPLPVMANTALSGTPALPMQDVGIEDGQTQYELLASILREVMISNHYLCTMIQQLNPGVAQTDEPAAFRSDPSFFNQ